MKKQFFYLLTILCLAVTFSSCEKDDAPKTNDAAFIYDKDELTQEIFADDTETEGGFAFTAKEAWSVNIDEATKSTTDDSWVEVSPMSGVAGAHTITINLDLNYTGEDREAEINIKAGESVITITVKQKGKTEAGVAPTQPKVITSYNVEYTSETEGVVFKYDDKGRLIELQITDGDTENYDITYNSDGFVWKCSDDKSSNYQERTYTLNDKGFVTKHIYKSFYNDILNDKDEIAYTYNGEEYLTKITSGSHESLFTWSNGNITKSVDTYTRLDVNPDGTTSTSNLVQTMTASYTNHENKTNMDMSGFVSYIWSYDFATLLRKRGESNVNFVAEEVVINDHQFEKQKEVYTYTYKFDDDGDPTEIKIVETATYRPDYNGEKMEDRTSIITLTYNK